MMFEKESEEWFEKLKQAKVPYTYENVNKQLHKAFKDGAEFGYNKANEWHFVKDGDLPNCTRKVLICYGKEEHIKFVYWRADLGTFGSALPVEITAWRYIEPPKEEE